MTLVPVVISTPIMVIVAATVSRIAMMVIWPAAAAQVGNHDQHKNYSDPLFHNEPPYFFG